MTKRKAKVTTSTDCCEALRRLCGDTTVEMARVSEQIAESLELLQEKEAAWRAMQLTVRVDAEKAAAKIKLDVGGKIFATVRNNLLRFEGSYFHAMLASGKWKPDCDDAYFLDLNPKHFDRVLEYLRSGELSFDGLSHQQVHTLRKTLDYLQLPAAYDDSVTWNAHMCGPAITLSEANRTAANASGSWQGVLSSTPCTRFSVRILVGTNLMVGFAPSSGFTPSVATYTSCGWYFNAYNGTLFAQGGVSTRAYNGAKMVTAGGLVTATLDRSADTISFEVNGRSFGVAYSHVQAGDLFAAITFSSGTVTLEDSHPLLTS